MVIAGDGDDEVALFDFHNRAFDAGKAVLYTARKAPDALGLLLPDLRSRLSQCTRIMLTTLDDARGIALMLSDGAIAKRSAKLSMGV